MKRQRKMLERDLHLSVIFGHRLLEVGVTALAEGALEVGERDNGDCSALGALNRRVAQGEVGKVNFCTRLSRTLGGGGGCGSGRIGNILGDRCLIERVAGELFRILELLSLRKLRVDERLESIEGLRAHKLNAIYPEAGSSAGAHLSGELDVALNLLGDRFALIVFSKLCDVQAKLASQLSGVGLEVIGMLGKLALIVEEQVVHLDIFAL